MNIEHTVRLAERQDLNSVYPLAKELSQSFEVNINDFESSFLDILDDDRSVCLVAESNKEVVGYLIGFDHIAFYANGHVSWVEEIFVREDNRMHGMGGSLMYHFEAWCAQRKSKLIALSTRRAAGFYQAIGYEESATYFKKHLVD